ncbi:nitrite reductase small subunit NirD [Janthinobacterium sp.]|uniref:nitrite reductase small subunit NirD n=1 Tax=Janthinobacterium sp. TaxID=1871054 RepID=UPI0026128A70|nr:nitrite reductase small subunit NirD [Janthinobacterium sp.]
MHRDLINARWTSICKLDAIVPNTGVCALVNGEQVAVFRLGDERVFAIDNYDGNAGASVLSRGLLGSMGERIVVASPIYKQHFDLLTGDCLEAPEHSVATWPVKVENGLVWVGA